MLKQGQKIPTDIKVFNLNGKGVTLNDYLGKPLVIYFYPKDNTAGCTREAQSFRDFKLQIEKLGAKIIGVSKDSVDSHRKFRDKHKLNFELLSDPDVKLIEAFGLWQEKRMFGKSYMGTIRATFVIDQNGIIQKVWPRVSPTDHGKEIYSYLKVSSKK